MAVPTRIEQLSLEPDETSLPADVSGGEPSFGDNTEAGLRTLLAANASHRTRAWPAPFDVTEHTLHLGDARDLSWIADESVHLVVTSPPYWTLPYWTLKEYRRGRDGQMGEIEDYERFLDELRVRGLARAKDWDVAYNFAGKDRLLVSLKSNWSTAGGTIPNRLDDLMGEAANMQQMAPEIVIGYIMLFDVHADAVRNDGQAWSQCLEAALQRTAVRKAPLWNQGLIEGIWLVRFDSRQPHGSRVVDLAKAATEQREFFLSLLRELRLREPAIPFTQAIPDAATQPPGE